MNNGDKEYSSQIENSQQGEDNENDDTFMSSSLILSNENEEVHKHLSKYDSNGNSLQRIPSEILSAIFEHLQLDDIKRVRRTCKLWNSCSKVFSIAKREKIVFRKGCTISVIRQILQSSNFAQVNLEFQGLDVVGLAEVWKTHGSGIRSLHFRGCHLNERFLRNVVLHCVNLDSLTIHNSERFRDTLESFVTMLNNLIIRCIKRKRLRNVAITGKKIPFSNDVPLLTKIYAVFPRTKHFSTELEKYCSTFSESSARQEVERVSYNDWFKGKYLRRLETRIETEILRLTQFESWFDLRYWTSSESSIKMLLDFFPRQKHLRTINLSVRNQCAFMKQFLFHILENCPNLRVLGFTCLYGGSGSLPIIELSSAEVTKFLTLASKLRSLKLNGAFRAEELPPVSSNKLTLNALHLRCVSGECKGFFFHLLKHCQSVEHLLLCSFQDKDVIREIFKTMCDLRTLIIHCCSSCSCSEFGFNTRGDEFSIIQEEQVQNLEHLQIGLMKCATQFVEKFGNGMQFPNLKYLKIFSEGNSKPLPFTSLHEVIPNMPKLEILELPYYHSTDWDQLIELCKSIRNLKLISLHFRPNYNMQPEFFYYNAPVSKSVPLKLKDLFKACPNLIFVSDFNKVFWINSFADEISIIPERDFDYSGRLSVFQKHDADLAR